MMYTAQELEQMRKEFHEFVLSKGENALTDPEVVARSLELEKTLYQSMEKNLAC